MPRARRRPPRSAAHYLAPLAFLAGVTIAVLLVHSALNRGRPATTTTPTTQTRPATVTQPAKPKHTQAKRFYTVQIGDTFGTIAGKVGISVERLQALNPGISSNALQVGQKLRIG